MLGSSLRHLLLASYEVQAPGGESTDALAQSFLTDNSAHRGQGYNFRILTDKSNMAKYDGKPRSRPLKQGRGELVTRMMHECAPLATPETKRHYAGLALRALASEVIRGG